MGYNTIPGTNMVIKENDGMFAKFKPLISATEGLTLGQVCAITGLESSTIQNWVKRKFVARPVNKKYHERQLARILLISSLRDAMKIDSIGELMSLVNGNTDDEADDIITEENMYDYFCKISKSAKDKEVNKNEIASLVADTISDYEAPDSLAFNKLRDALTVMVYAYIASEYKREAENMLNDMRNETEVDAS
ncbi:MAG: DUF1836 domain-containing protein [Eubacterium sp.]|nr:DUF1836 domain-containing protein [Eubacterium sp.]